MFYTQFIVLVYRRWATRHSKLHWRRKINHNHSSYIPHNHTYLADLISWMFVALWLRCLSLKKINKLKISIRQLKWNKESTMSKKNSTLGNLSKMSQMLKCFRSRENCYYNMFHEKFDTFMLDLLYIYQRILYLTKSRKTLGIIWNGLV